MDRTSLRSKLRRESICKAVEENPGSNYQNLLKYTGFANGVLSHHLKRLEVEGRVRVRRSGRLTWFFPIFSDSDHDCIIINLRKETCRNILLFLLSRESATFVEITRAIRKSPATTSYTLKQLTEDKTIRIIPGFQKKYSLHDKDHTKDIMRRLEITRMDTLTDRFADSFSYY